LLHTTLAFDRYRLNTQNKNQIRFSEVRHWLFDKALPFWSRNGLDASGLGFNEQLDCEGRSTNLPYKRMRAQARQVYVYSHAYLMGWDPKALDYAKVGYDFITEHGWLAQGGWAKCLGREGGIVDDTLDLYDNAFVMFALAWYFKATGNIEAIELAHYTLDNIYEKLARPDGRGFYEADKKGQYRLQNPHMHYLEAMLALYDATDDERFKTEASKTAALFLSTFYESETQTLAEYYDDNWERAQGTAGKLVEPGHHFEWVWLLFQTEQATGNKYITSTKGLFDFAYRHGYNSESGITVDVILNDGTPYDSRARTWPQTEALKAHLARAEHTDHVDLEAIAQITNLLLDQYLVHEQEGAWRDQFDEHGNACTTTIPSSTFYHVFLAFSELLRLENKLTAYANDSLESAA
jgi:mannose/cellobiose epimerase-like protein (N-acyl-D-glucosamine 2-epimerase family)